MQNNISYLDSVDQIINLNKEIAEFWSNAEGWAPKQAVDLLSKSRLDWLLSLSYSLKRWNKNNNSHEENGDLILAWVNLGALVEGSLKLFLCIYYEDYKDDINKITYKGIMKDPASAMFNHLIIFFKKSVWAKSEIQHKSKWLEKIRDRRNTVHAFQNRELDNFTTFKQDVIYFSSFLESMNNRLPYPELH